jgi:phosphomannomutase
MNQATFSENLKTQLQSVKGWLAAPTLSQIDDILGSPNADFWEVAKLIGTACNVQSCSADEKTAGFALISTIREYQGELARTSPAPTTVVFGTSGWRGVIGKDFTVTNVHKVSQSIVEMMRCPEFLTTNGYSSFRDVQQHGIVLLRDNRFMGDAFIEAAAQELAAAGIRILLAGECPTGVGSALVTELKAAGSFNFTPSHNPMEYAGLKFNPADGGPADTNLTSIIETKANALMQPGADFSPATASADALIEPIDAAAIMTNFLETKSRVFDLPRLRDWLKAHKNELCLIVDNMHGSSRGYIQAILGDTVIQELTEAGSIQFLNTNDDYSFHGLKPEPSAANQAPLIKMLQESGRPLTLAVALDPDADRIRFADAKMDIEMNLFGPLAYANLLGKGLSGGVASTVASSDFALEIARQKGLPVFETAVGFKNFRPCLSKGEAIIAFEESDGITFAGHTLEKCAIAGFLAALDAMATNGTNLSEQFHLLQQTFGYFYPDKQGTDVKGVSIDEWQAYKQAVVQTLQTMFVVGDQVKVGGEDKEITAVLTSDGAKVVFADKSWILLRPSGTEPKFRYYYELASPNALSDVATALAAYGNAAAEILAQARTRVDAGV